MSKAYELQSQLNACLQDNIEFCEVKRGQVILQVNKDHLHSVCHTLRDHPDLKFEMLMDVCGVDYSEYGLTEWETSEASNSGFCRGVERQSVVQTDDAGRFAVVYHLLSPTHNWRLILQTRLDGDAPMVESVIDIWPSANWNERETFDLFGIQFNNHPDLRRILTDYGFVGHPFRKDFPQSGYVEVRYDAAQQRVVYEPVDIRPRVLVPRVVRDDNRNIKSKGVDDGNHS